MSLVLFEDSICYDKHSNIWDIDLDYCDVEWFVLETNQDHSVTFQTAPKYCISDSFVDY